jgi:intermembrane space import and assembly protein 40
LEGVADPGESETPEQEGTSGGAFNPVTGEINWDCPCLGGMAHGPCGPEFREAFSCFVFSEAEPKGINCVDKFQNMQNCFRAHPEVYADGTPYFVG